MSKKINKAIIEDFEKNYNIEVDKEKILKNLNITRDKQENKLKTILKLKQVCNRLVISMSVLVVVLVGVICFFTFNDHKSTKNNDATNEFDAYMEEYTSLNDFNLYNLINVNSETKICIYKVINKSNNIDYYFYIIKNENDLPNKYLYIQDTKILALNNSYGLLCEIDTTKANPGIYFSIEIDGIVTDYKIG